MKGALAAMIHGAASVDRSCLSGRIAVSATVMEENLEGAALQTVMELIHPGYIVIGESTDLNLSRGGRGRAEIHLETIGRPSHSSSPHLGRNAILDMVRVVEAIEHLPMKTDPLLGPSLLALTEIRSEPYPAYSVIPSRCRATYDKRLILDETPDSVLDAITGLPELAGITLRAEIAEGEHRTYTGSVLKGLKFFPAWALPENHPFVQTCLQGLRRVGLDPKLGAYRFCTNAAYSAGVANVQTIGFGPGREENAHIVDERLSLDALKLAKKGYRGIIDAILTR
jgi:putative selenium metabolism hydrolase